MKDKPEAIMINVPEAFFKHDGKIKGDRETEFRRFYEIMGTSEDFEGEFGCFYHFIASIPIHEVNTVFVCFKGKVQYKAIIVEFLRNQPVHVGDYNHAEPRDWVVTTGPVTKPPHDIPMKGFRGFRYCEMLF